MELHAELDTLLKHILRLVARVNITHLLRFHEALIMVNDGINDTVSDCLGNNLLSLLNRI